MLRFVKITEENVWQIIKLRVSEEQKEFDEDEAIAAMALRLSHGR